MRRPYVFPMTLPTSGKIYIGTSGFSYDHWANGVFYPEGLPRKEWLPYYASQFNSVELNMTFLKLPEKESFVQWQSQVPAEFRFSVKGYQYITHVKRLSGTSEPLRLFMDRVTKLKENLACIVWELPLLGSSKMKLLEGFLGHLKKYPNIRHAFELTDPSLQVPEVTELLKKHQMTVMETDDNEASMEKDGPFSFLYRHLKGESPKGWARKVSSSSQEGIDSFCYFTQEAQAKSIQEARAFLERLKEGG